MVNLVSPVFENSLRHWFWKCNADQTSEKKTSSSFAEKTLGYLKWDVNCFSEFYKNENEPAWQEA